MPAVAVTTARPVATPPGMATLGMTPRGMTLALGDTVGPEDLSLATPVREQAIPEPHPGFALHEYLRRTEIQLVIRAMEIAEDRRPEAAKLLGISERALKYLLSKLRPE